MTYGHREFEAFPSQKAKVPYRGGTSATVLPAPVRKKLA